MAKEDEVRKDLEEARKERDRLNAELMQKIGMPPPSVSEIQPPSRGSGALFQANYERMLAEAQRRVSLEVQWGHTSAKAWGALNPPEPKTQSWEMGERSNIKKPMNKTANLINDITRSELISSCDRFINNILSEEALEEVNTAFQELFDTFGTLDDSDVEQSVNQLIERAVSSEL